MNQPAGGFGGEAPMQGGGPMQGYPPPPRKSSGNGVIILVVVLVLLVPMIGILSVLAIFGVRKYIANAKTAEARNSIGMIAKEAVAAYEGDTPRTLCSTSTKVPSEVRLVAGTKYQSSSSDWDDRGWKCLHFAMNAPQYYQYQYGATSDAFEARAVGDLNGDGTTSLFVVEGQVEGDRIRVSPSIREESPEE